jgi:hypothetical protein
LKTAVWARQAWPIAEALPGFDPITLGFARAGKWIAACIVADPSEFKMTAFSLQAFALPLFLPTQHLYFDYGFRVGERWESVSSELVAAVRTSVPELEKLATFDGLLAAASHSDVNIYHAELRLCVALLTGDAATFGAITDRISTWKQHVEWERPVIDRCLALAESVAEGGSPAGIVTLERRRRDVMSLLI